jgi:hypothetical protein
MVGPLNNRRTESMLPTDPNSSPFGAPFSQDASGGSLPVGAGSARADEAGSARYPLPARQPLQSGALDHAPSPRDMRLTGWTPQVKCGFLEALARCGNVRSAAAFVSMSREGAYKLRRRDRAFALAWEGALVQARELAEDVLQDKALNGIVEQLSYHGEVIDTRTRFDGRLLLALLRRLDKRAESETAMLGADRFDALLDAISADADAGDLLEMPAQARARAAAEAQAARIAAAQDDEDALEADPHMIWEEGDEWYTDYPAPLGYEGIEDGDYGDADYRRTLSPEELAGLGVEEETAADLARAEAQRRAAFGLDAVDGEDQEQEGAEIASLDSVTCVNPGGGAHATSGAGAAFSALHPPEEGSLSHDRQHRALAAHSASRAQRRAEAAL